MSKDRMGWVILPHIQGEVLDALHPDDRRILIEKRQGPLLVSGLRREGPYLVVDYNNSGSELRILESEVDWVTVPVVPVGAEVRLKDGQPAVIRYLEWHFKEGRPFYLLSVNEKKKSKRYYDTEFTIVNSDHEPCSRL